MMISTMYEDLINRLNAYSAEYQNHGGITAEAADVIHRLSHQADDWEKIATYWRDKYEELNCQIQEK